MIRHLGHVAYVSGDYERMRRFYLEVLGLKEAFSLHHDDGSLMLTYFQVSEENFLELFPAKEGREFSAPGSGYYMHLCLLVDSMATTQAELEAKGVAIQRGPSTGRDGNIQLWINDPDGNPIEFMEIHPDSPQGRAAVRWREQATQSTRQS
ncbi:MAG: VOC family protein [Blastochloris sp.]|nr:VOC family protein [Blastochloris sp.]